MTSDFKVVLRALALGTALGLSPAFAQDNGTDIQTLIELARNGAGQDIVSLPGSDLIAILDAASPAQLFELVRALPADEVDALLIAVAQARRAQLLARLVSRILAAFPDATDRIIGVMLQNVAPADLPLVASALVDLIESDHADMSIEVLERHVIAALSLDPTQATRLVAMGNTWDAANAAQLASALVAMIERDLAAAAEIETALALQGGQMLQLAAVFRGEVAVGEIPEAPADPPPPPAVPPAVIGGGGAAPGGAGAATSGVDALFAAGTTSAPGLTDGPSFSAGRPARGSDVSPTN